jgi:predicted permease
VNPIQWARLRLRAIAARRALERDMQEEMAAHIERATERYVARGLAFADARREATREFGNVGMLQEQARDARGGRWAHDLATDLRFALRYFARHKANTGIIVAVLSLGTGANALIFSMFQAEFLRPAPAVSRHDAIRIWGQERSAPTAPWQPRLFAQSELIALTERSDILRDVAAWTEEEVIVGSDSISATATRAVNAQFVTPNFFRALGVPLSAGPGFPQDGDGNHSTSGAPAVIAYATAEQRFGSAEAAIGRRITVNETPAYIVGVAPPRFQGALRNMHWPALWIPLSARADIDRISPHRVADEAMLSVIAHLAPSASRDRAVAFARQVLANSLPDSAAHTGVTRTAVVIGMQQIPPGKDTREVRVALSLIVAVGILILLVACANVSSLMVAAALGRRHEIAVRVSLGASRARLLRQLVTESTLLSLAGSAAGLTVVWWFLLYLAKANIDGVSLAPDVGTFVFALGMALATGILFGLSPALHAIRGGLADALRDPGTAFSTRGRLQRGFVIAQIALSQPLLVLLGTILSLVIAEYRPLAAGMSRHVIAIEFRPLTTGAPGQRAQAVDSLVPQIAHRLEVVDAVPDVATLAIRTVVDPHHRAPARAQRAPDSTRTIMLDGAAPGWFATLSVPIIFGRDVSFADTIETRGQVPVVIGSDLARRLWGQANPVGRSLASPALPGSKQDSITMAVVGVYDAARRTPGMNWSAGITRDDEPALIYTARGKQWRHDRVLVRTRGPAAPFVPALQVFVRDRAPSLPVLSVLTLAQSDELKYEDVLRRAATAGAGGVVALLLASLGLFGIVSLAVRERTREIGIRIAIGATPTEVVRMFLGSGVRVSLAALALGLPLSIAGLRIALNERVLMGSTVHPYGVGIAIALLMVSVTAAATWLPARRAARVDPVKTLRVQ